MSKKFTLRGDRLIECNDLCEGFGHFTFNKLEGVTSDSKDGLSPTCFNQNAPRQKCITKPVEPMEIPINLHRGCVSLASKMGIELKETTE